MDSINWTDNNIRDVMESDSKVDIEDILGVGEFESEDGMSDCENDDEDDIKRGISDDKKDNSIVNMVRDISDRLFKHIGDKEIELEVG